MPETMSWFRFYSETPHDRKVARVKLAANTSKANVLAIWAVILSMASDSPVRGRLLIASDEQLTREDVASETELDMDTVNAVMDAMGRYEMIHDENGVICVTNWDKRQFASDVSTSRVQKHRTKKNVAGNVSGNGDGNAYETFQKQHGNGIETHQNRTESETDTEQIKSTPSWSDFPTIADDGNDAPSGQYAAYEQVFVEETKLPIFSGGPQRWYQGFQDIVATGATPEDFRSAIRELAAAVKNGRSYNLTSPASFVNATANVVAARNVKTGSTGKAATALDPDAQRRAQLAARGIRYIGDVK